MPVSRATVEKYSPIETTPGAAPGPTSKTCGRTPSRWAKKPTGMSVLAPM